jgi:hypothetical protein
MRVQRVLLAESSVESWTVLGDDHVPVEPVERFLAYLASIERSPNSIKAYAHDLKDWFTFLASTGREWRSATVEDVAMFVAWLRLPPAAREGMVAVLPRVGHHCSQSSVNRKLAALTSFCEFHARHGVRLVVIGWSTWVGCRVRGPDAAGTVALLLEADRFSAGGEFQPVAAVAGSGHQRGQVPFLDLEHNGGVHANSCDVPHRHEWRPGNRRKILIGDPSPMRLAGDHVGELPRIRSDPAPGLIISAPALYIIAQCEADQCADDQYGDRESCAHSPRDVPPSSNFDVTHVRSSRSPRDNRPSRDPAAVPELVLREDGARQDRSAGAPPGLRPTPISRRGRTLLS